MAKMIIKLNRILKNFYAYNFSFDFGNGNVFNRHFKNEILDELYLDYPVESSQVLI